MISPNPSVDRLTLLPAYPSFDRFGLINRDHLLLANVPHQELTVEQRRRRDCHSFHPPFAVIDQSVDSAVRPFFVYVYRQMYGDLARRLQLDNAIIDYNYERLHEYINIMTQERIRHGLLPVTIVGSEQLRIDEYPLALEFFLKIDDRVFFMKTCSFRDALPSLYNHRGIFCVHPPQAYYGMTICRMPACRLCYPKEEIIIGARQGQPVVQFSSGQTHRFVNGYEAILNAPAVCFYSAKGERIACISSRAQPATFSMP